MAAQPQLNLRHHARADLAEKRDALREVIQTAAIAEFARHGLRGASTQGIATRAGISKTKLHYHISSKEELYAQALSHILTTWEEMFEGITLDTGPEAFLTDYITRKIHFSLRFPNEVRMFTSEVMRGAPMLRQNWAGSRAATLRAVDRITSWADQGLIRRVDPLLLQFHIWALTESYAVLAVELEYMMGAPGVSDGSNRMAEARICDEVVTLVLHGLRP
jgi:TetR/AcrR family transcriptional regulator